MPYRAPGVREKQGEDERPRAVFQVRHRSWLGLVIAIAVAIGAIAFAVTSMMAPKARELAVLTLAGPTIIFAAALHRTFELAAEVALVVEGIAEQGIVRVTLRRRWGLLPWSRPLVFDAARVPSLSTDWETCRFSSKYGRGRKYKRASLALNVGGIPIALPVMRGPHGKAGDIVVIDHAPVVLEAVAQYERSAAVLRDALGQAKVGRRSRRKRAGAPESEEQRSLADADSKVLVASAEGAFGRAAMIALLTGLAVSVILGLAAYFLPRSTVTFVCAAFVLPVFGGVIALVAAATSHGHTLHFEKRERKGTSVWTVPDLFLFGPMGSSESHALEPQFEFYVNERVSGEDETTTYAIVDARTGKTLLIDADENIVRRFGERLGGRLVDARSKSLVS